MATIICIVGVGRSGSTLLDIMLGQNQQIFSCGELSNISTVVKDKHLCSCGQDLTKCGFWSNIIKSVHLAPAQSEMNMNHPGRVRSWVCLLGTYGRKLYVQRSDYLVDKIASLANAKYVVDSSKSPLRLALFKRWSRHKILVIHLVRDPAAVSNSLAQSINRDLKQGVPNRLDSRRPLRSYILWTVVNTLSEIVLLFVPKKKKQLVRYEDVIENPKKVYKEILNFIGIECSSNVNFSEKLIVQHIMSGNRMRMVPMKIRTQKKYAPNVIATNSRSGELFSILLRIRYGYLRRD